MHLWLGKARPLWLPVTAFLLLASVFQLPIAGAQSAPGFIDEVCDVVTIPRLRATYELFWNPECPSNRFTAASRYLKFSVPERQQYRIATNSGSSFAVSDLNLITLYNASGDIVEESSPEREGGFTFRYSSEVIANLDPGTYYVEVVTFENELFSRVPFELSIHPFPRAACRNSDNIELGKTVSGRWDTECVSVTADQSARFFQVSLSVDAIVRFQLFSSTIADVRTRLLDQNWNLVAQGDTKLNTDVLPAGSYLLEAATSRGSTEEFQIQTRLVGAVPDNAFRPIQGAVGIASRDGICTLGFAAAIRLAAEEIKGVVTNSHCTDALGRQDNTQLSQGGGSITLGAGVSYSSDGGTNRLIGELADSNLLDWSSPADAFETPVDRLTCSTNCQYSDAAFFVLEEGFDASYSITRLKGINTNTPQALANNDYSLSPSTRYLEVDFARPSFEIVGVGNAEEGDTVHKIGRTTGWTTGVVSDVCEPLTVNYSEGLVDLFCQNTFAHPRGRVVSGDGDSGSPVFKCVTASGRDDPGCQNSQQVILVGILHSGPNRACSDVRCYGSSANFSSVDNVLREFNKSFEGGEVCWVLTSAGNCYSPPPKLPPISSACQPDTLSMGVPVSDGFGDDCFSVLRDSEENARYFNLQLTGETELQIAVRGADNATLISAHDFSYGEVVGELEMGTVRAQLPAADYILEVVGREGRSFSVLAANAEQGPLQLEDPNRAPDPPQVEPSMPMTDLQVPALPPEVTTTDNRPSPNTLLAIGLLALVTAVVLLVAIILRLRRGRSSSGDAGYTGRD